MVHTKKLLNSLISFFFCFFCFSFEIKTDIFLSGFYNYDNIFKGTAQFEKNYNYVDGDYKAAFNAFGGSIGFDMFFNQYPIGLYFRAGFMGVKDVKRTAANITVNLINTELEYNMFYDVGAAFNYDFNNYFSLGAAPAFSFIFLTSEYRNFNNLYNSRATIDSLFGLGLTADLYAKYKYKHFIAAIGCATSFYPFALVNSSDSDFYYGSVKKNMAFNLRPYISAGVSF